MNLITAQTTGLLPPLTTPQPSAQLPSAPPTRQASVDAIAQLLGYQEPAGEVLEFLTATENQHLVKNVISRDDFGFNVRDLRYSLERFVEADVPHDLLKDAAAQALKGNADPDFARQMCKAVIELGLFPPEQPLGTWIELGRAFQTEWATDGMPREGLQRLEGSPPQGQVAPAAGQPNTPAQAIDEEPLLALRRRLEEAAQANGAGQGANGVFSEIHRKLLEVLTSRKLPPMSVGDATAFATTLLGMGEEKVLRHFLVQRSHWSIEVRTAREAQDLAQITAWPDGSHCELRIAAPLAGATLQPVLDFAKTVPPSRLELCIFNTPNADDANDALWDAWARTVQACPGLSVVVRGPRQLPVQALTDFLLGLAAQPTPVRRVALHGSLDDNADLAHALAQFLQASDTSSLALLDCSEVLAEKLIAVHHWQELEIENAPALAPLFENGRTGARKLTLHMVDDAMVWAEQQASMEKIVGTCAGLQSVLIEGTTANFEAVVNALDRNRSVTFIDCSLSTRGAAQTEAALGVLHKNTSIQTIYLYDGWIPVLPGEDSVDGSDVEELLNPVHINAALDIPRRNRWLDPQRTAVGAGKGFGLSLGRALGLGEALVDFGSRVGPVLDSASVQALSGLDKTTYFGARQAWEEDVEALAAQLLPPAPSPSDTPGRGPRDTLLANVEARLESGVPAVAIGQTLGRNVLRCMRRHTAEQPLGERDRQVTILSLEAMAYAGTLPPLRWLREGLGMDVPAT